MAFLLVGVDAVAQDTSDADPRYLELDEHPTFKGGSPNDFALWVARNVKYPKYAKEAGIEGTVLVHFVIGTNGKISEAHVHQKPGKGKLYDAGSLQLQINRHFFKKMPKFVYIYVM